MLLELDSGLFDWLSWKNGDPSDLIGYRHCRTSDLIRYRAILREHAVGYCEGNSTLCRPKEGTIAVMYFIEDRYFWFHLSNKEFAVIFCNHQKEAINESY